MRKRRSLLSSSSSSSGLKEEEHENEVDIISNLPEHILHYMFSFVDMKQAIQTCLLSRRWRYFWVSLPILKFSYDKSNRKTIRNEFIDFVDRVLMFRSNFSSIDEFTLVTNRNIDVTDRLSTWILASVIRNVQQLTIHTHFPKKFHFHHSLFTCKSLTKLVVIASNYKYVSLGLPDSISLPRLKTLSLSSVKFEDEYSTNQLFSGCPILESLVIKNCQFLRINISSPQLQHLVIENCRTGDTLDLKPVNYNDIKFKLCAPNLISFYCGDCMSACCDLKNLCSLVKAHINVYFHFVWSKKEKAMYAPHMVNILRELHNVEDLTLSASFLEVISGDPDLFDRQHTKFCNLRCLKLKGGNSIDYIHGISYLLKISPNIETLSIEEIKCWRNAVTDLLDVQPTHFCNLRCLKMHALLSRNWIYAIACLLKICPNAETLSYTVYPNMECALFSGNNLYCDEMNSDLISKKNKKKKMNSDPTIKRYFGEAGLSLECLLNNLKCFELRDVTGRINELELLQILLKNAIVLEKLLIVFAGTCGCFMMKCYCVIVRKKFSEKVLTFSRASPSVAILFKFSEKLLR